MSRRTSTILIAGVVVLAGSPFAFSATRGPIREGVRNPSASAATRETQIIARTGPDTYGTRQSNLGDGGSAIYGCRSALDPQAIGDPKRSTPCIRARTTSPTARRSTGRPRRRCRRACLACADGPRGGVARVEEHVAAEARPDPEDAPPRGERQVE
jgi:hypothetical protein